MLAPVSSLHQPSPEKKAFPLYAKRPEAHTTHRKPRGATSRQPPPRRLKKYESSKSPTAQGPQL